jgi:hypothetical protein
MVEEPSSGIFKADSMAASTNCDANNKRKPVYLLAGPDPRILIHTGMLKRIVTACGFREIGHHKSSRVQPLSLLDKDDGQILCHFDLVVTASLITRKARTLPNALKLLQHGQQSNETKHPLADLTHTRTNGLLFHNQAYASTASSRFVLAAIELHQAEKPDDIVCEDNAPYSGCHEIQLIQGYLDETSYEDFEPPKYEPWTAEEEAQTPATDAD